MTSKPKPSCERCGKQCRTENPLYGWVCGRCEHELDTYYMQVIGLRGGDVVSLFLWDRLAGTVPGPFR